MKGTGMLSSIKSRFNAWREQRAQERRVKGLRVTWERMSDAQRQNAKQKAVEQVRAQLAQLRRAQLMDKARNAFLQDDRVVALPGGRMWWPGLAPLTQAERRLVRSDLGLKV